MGYSITSYKKGHVPWSKDRVFSEEHRRKISQALIGNHCATGRVLSKEHKRKLSFSNIGKHNISEETRKKLSKSHLGQTGNLAGNWRGGITTISNLIRKGLKYKEWRQKIFFRDNFTCQKCGHRGGDLEVHHKESFSKIINKVGLSCLCDAYQILPLWDIGNGITLCINCHKKEDKFRR